MNNTNVVKNWDTIKSHFRNSFATNLHVSIASVNVHNQPTVTPIGSFFLTNNQKGFYFEILTSNLPKNAKVNKKVCVLAVNSGKWFWIKSLFGGKFAKSPAIKLYGELGEKRLATKKEIKRFERRVKWYKQSKGYHLLWGNLKYVREIDFTHAEMANIGKMTSHL